MYEQLKEIFDKFTCDKVLKESLHWMNTQQNEAMNNAIARLWPKNKHLSKTTTLLTCVWHFENVFTASSEIRDSNKRNFEEVP